jgi:hypothetical protein
VKVTSIDRVASVEARGKPNALDKGGGGGAPTWHWVAGARSGGGGAQDRILLVRT